MNLQKLMEIPGQALNYIDDRVQRWDGYITQSLTEIGKRPKYLLEAGWDTLKDFWDLSVCIYAGASFDLTFLGYFKPLTGLAIGVGGGVWTESRADTHNITDHYAARSGRDFFGFVTASLLSGGFYEIAVATGLVTLVFESIRAGDVAVMDGLGLGDKSYIRFNRRTNREAERAIKEALGNH